MDAFLIVVSSLSGAFVLSLGVVSGFWLHDAATDPGRATTAKHVRELMTERKGRQHQIEHVAARLSHIIAAPDWASARREAQELQKWVTDRPLDA